MPTNRTASETRYGRTTGGQVAATPTVEPVTASYRSDGRPAPTRRSTADGDAPDAERTDSDLLRGSPGAER